GVDSHVQGHPPDADARNHTDTNTDTHADGDAHTDAHTDANADAGPASHARLRPQVARLAAVAQRDALRYSHD
ncbi:MAG TPA: hypothetical protein VGV38_20420, partial [Pyrinomonadaceae bacterium]|nr:hypothetical protein [Pyrinomonadaceae bacterium]